MEGVEAERSGKRAGVWWPGKEVDQEGSMPPEHDDARARQLEALRRYVAEVGAQRERPTELGAQRERPSVTLTRPQPAPERPRWPPLPWLLVTGLLVTVALVGGMFLGAVVWSHDRPASPPAGGGNTAAAQVASPECKAAVDRANKVLAVAVRMRTALAQHAAVASGEPARFDRALDEYRQVVDQCTLRAP
jgi:hypothetical protein